MPAEFEIHGVEYRSEKMPAMTQLHVSRRLLQVLPAIRELAAGWVASASSENGEEPKELTHHEKMARLTEAMTIAGRRLAEVSDADTEYVIDACMKLVRWKRDGRWEPVWNTITRQPMFDQIDMQTMLTICSQVLAAEFMGFFQQDEQSFDLQPQTSKSNSFQ